MTGVPENKSTAQSIMTCAHATCLALGIALLAWAFAPAVIERLITNEPPELSTLIMGTVAFVLGGTYVGLHLLIRRGVRWALWAGFVVSLVIATATVSISVLDRTRFASTFLLVLSGAVIFSTWLALKSEKPARPTVTEPVQ